ncbi:MAG TPA: hypothetical protein DCQ61_04310 [Gammaproteobacteria bacterium]|nr:hypothetical protein [Gammaproteobacteria bacterium]HCK62312.1 hypothetical protein [Gammaproteobacteria bacterium]
MVLKLFIYSLCILLSPNIVADTQTKDTINPLIQKIEAIDYDLLELETQLDMGIDVFEIGVDASKIKSQLLHFEYQLGTPRGGDDQWNESEQMILDAKVKLEALQEKMKVEGDWGKVRFRVQDFRGDDPGTVKIRYNYGF